MKPPVTKASVVDGGVVVEFRTGTHFGKVFVPSSECEVTPDYVNHVEEFRKESARLDADGPRPRLCKQTKLIAPGDWLESLIKVLTLGLLKPWRGCQCKERQLEMNKVGWRGLPSFVFEGALSFLKKKD